MSAPILQRDIPALADVGHAKAAEEARRIRHGIRAGQARAEESRWRNQPAVAMPAAWRRPAPSRRERVLAHLSSLALALALIGACGLLWARSQGWTP